MNSIEWFDPSVCGRICLTLLHSIWQVAVLALVASITARQWIHRPQWGYVVSVLALFVALALLPITYEAIGSSVGEKAGAVATADLDAEPDHAALTTFIVSDAPASIDTTHSKSELDAPKSAGSESQWLNLASWIVAIYVAGVAWMMARLVLLVWRANRIGTDATPITAGPIFEMLQRIASAWSMNLLPALAIADRVVMPKVIGILRPTILLPASALVGLPPDELELILAHELAHVRRHDMWINLAQRIAEATLFFNPAVWILSRQISRQREYCCDQAACSFGGGEQSQARYAMALLHVVELIDGTASRERVAALAVSGRSPSELRRRVARLFGEPVREPVRITREGIIGLAAMFLLVFAGPVVWRAQAQTGQAQSPQSQSASGDADGTQADVATPEASEVPTREFESASATRSPANRGDHSAVWFHSGEHVHFVIYYPGFLQTKLEYAQLDASAKMPLSTLERSELEKKYRDFRLNAPLAWDSEGKATNPHRERQLLLLQKSSGLKEQLRRKRILLAAVESVAKTAKDASEALPIMAQLLAGQHDNERYKQMIRRKKLAAAVEVSKAISSLQVQRSKYLAEFGAHHPMVMQLDKQLEVMNGELERLVGEKELGLEALQSVNGKAVAQGSIQEIEKKLIPIMIERNKFAAQFGENHPTVKQLDTELDLMKTELKRVVEAGVRAVLNEMEQTKETNLAAESVAGIVNAVKAEVAAFESQIAELSQALLREKVEALKLAKYEKEDLAYRRQLDASLWAFKGSINAIEPEVTSGNSQKRQVQVDFRNRGDGLSLELAGKSYDLDNGQLFVVGNRGQLTQLSTEPPPVADREKIEELKDQIQAAMAE